jgi:hypothetical protein
MSARGSFHFFHLETRAKLLKSLERVWANFPKCALKSLDNQTDFDSAIPRFESWRPSDAGQSHGRIALWILDAAELASLS